jgi:hypothetical protein
VLAVVQQHQRAAGGQVVDQAIGQAPQAWPTHGGGFPDAKHHR